MPRVAPALSLAALALFGSILAGCGGNSSNANGCGTHQYSYVGGGLTVVGGAPWYGGDYGGGWYDPGDDGSDYSDESGSTNGSGGNAGSGDDGSGNYYGDGSGDDGSGDDGSYDDGSGDDGSGDDGSGSTDDGSGDDGSGDDGSGDDGTASKKHLHTSNAKLHTALHTQSGSSHTNSCYAYSCDLLCAVGSPATAEREAHGYSAISANDACVTAAHGVETWAHDSLGSHVSACKLVTGDQPDPNVSSNGSRTPAAPAVTGGASSSSSGTTRSALYTGRTIR